MADKPTTKPVSIPETAIPLRKALAMDLPVQTGAGKGPFGGDKGKKTPA